jgi:Ca-activated chloride channel family protein
MSVTPLDPRDRTGGIRLGRSWSVAAMGLVIAFGVLPACTSTPAPPAVTVLAGSELKDLEPLFARIEQAVGVTLQMDYTGTLAGAEQILRGTPADLAWFSSARYLTLAQGDDQRVLEQDSIMLSPVVLGVNQEVARRFGWEDNPNVTWADVEAKTASDQFRYAMTNPAASNSGFSALVGVASALSGTGNALTEQDIDVEQLKAFFSGQALTAGSSGFLADSFVREQDRLDGMINYESILLELNASGTLAQPLDLIYPKDGIITADYPLMLLDPSKRAVYDRLVRFLKSPDIQRWIMTHTNRRPVIPEVRPDDRFPTQVLLELPFPSTLSVINSLLTAYLNEIRLPAHAVFVLDTSGSMEGSRLEQLQRALIGLTGLDTSLTGRFSQFRAREDLTFITFSSAVNGIQRFTIDTTDPTGPSLTAVRQFVESLSAGGNTAIFTALNAAYAEATAALQADPSRFTSIVLMTDGENNNGITVGEFLDRYHALGAVAQQIKTFPVLFGDADPQELHAVADATGGEVFDSRTGSLSEVFKDIRGFQ